jgi:MmyB-like transcription regulator ligand binding domain
MERGNLAGVSEGVLEAVAGALRLDEAERAHLFDLARASRDRASGRRRSPARRTVRPSVEWMIDAMTGAAAFVVNSRQDILAANHLGRAFYAPVFESRAPANMARFTYLDPRARDFFADWNRTAKECVAALRTQAGRDPFNRDLADLVGDLTLRYERLAVAADPGLEIFAYMAEPGSRSEEAFSFLASYPAHGSDLPSHAPIKTDA